MTACAPLVFGSSYWVTSRFLPADSPLWGSALRALPAGLVLLLVARRLPRGAWWWRAPLLGTLNMGAFFFLIYVAAQALPSSVATSVTAVGPLLMAGFAWLLAAQRPSAAQVLGAFLGLVGVLLVVGAAAGRLDPLGLAAAGGAVVLASLGATLAARWQDGTPTLATTAWQLVAAGAELLLLAAVVEGAPPMLPPTSFLALAYLSLVATALGYVCWFTGFKHLPAALVGVIGLLNPVTGVALGLALAGETLTPSQVLGVGLVLASILIAQRRGGGRQLAWPGDRQARGDGPGEPLAAVPLRHATRPNVRR